jgi:(p)ppGpp synthase/HD superfamily hydrolase
MTSSLIKKALYFAAEKHDGQYRKGIIVPYIVHPVSVAFDVCLYTKDDEIISAAFLHDVLEDCADVTFSVLEKEFGNRVAKMVDEVSFSHDKKNKTWREKKEAYLEKIKNASRDAMLIVAVDKMNNMKSYFDGLKDGIDMSGFGGNTEDYRWYYSTILDNLTSKISNHKVTKDYISLWDVYKNKNL